MKITVLSLSLLFSISFLTYCGQSAKNEAVTSPLTQAKELADEENMPAEPEAEKDSLKKSARRSGGTEAGLNPTLTPARMAGLERYLEYQIRLTYEVSDFKAARQKLQQLAGQFGFLTSSSASADTAGFMNMEFALDSNRLYDGLKQLDEVGKLISEYISSTDHTAGVVRQNRVANRETLRSRRRISAPSSVKTWSEKERLIAQSEDNLDNAEQAKWEMLDRVKWARVQVVLQGPAQPQQVEVPAFRNAFVSVLSSLLAMVYYLIIISPFIGVAGLVFWAGMRLRRRLKKS